MSLEETRGFPGSNKFEEVLFKDKLVTSLPTLLCFAEYPFEYVNILGIEKLLLIKQSILRSVFVESLLADRVDRVIVE